MDPLQAPTNAVQAAQPALLFEPSEQLISFLREKTAIVFPGGESEQQLQRLIRSCEDANMIPGEVGAVAQLIEIQPVAELKDMCELKMLAGRHPGELAAVRQALSSEPNITFEGMTERRERLIGILFREIEKSSPGAFTWQQASEVFNANCALEPPKGDRLACFVLTPAARAFEERYSAQAARNSGQILEKLGGENAPEFLRNLYAKFTPAFIERPIQLTDRGETALIDGESSILREDVVTRLDLSRSESGKAAISATVYFGGGRPEKIFSDISHELIETAIMQRIINMSDDEKRPNVFFIQYLAERNISDLLVWGVQLKMLKDRLDSDSAFSNADRALVLFMSGALKKFPVVQLLGRADPLVRELDVYQRCFDRAARYFDGHDIQVIAQNMEPGASDRAKAEYSELLDRTFTRFFAALSHYAAQHPDAQLMLHNPEILFSS